MSDKQLAGRTALVTGGVSGIGRAIVARFVEEGAAVAFLDITEPAGQAFAAELSAAGASVRFIGADATSAADMERAVQSALQAFGKLDILVNNVGAITAGDPLGAGIEGIDLAGWEATIKICLTSCMLGMKYALRPMLAAGSGAIVNIASLAGMRFTPQSTFAYNAAKAGVIHLSQTAGVMYAKSGIRVNVVSPGLTLTPLIAAATTPEQRQAMADATHPMGRLMRPSELANACLWAASDQSSGVTGLTIPVDGGWAAR